MSWYAIRHSMGTYMIREIDAGGCDACRLTAVRESCLLGACCEFVRPALDVVVWFQLRDQAGNERCRAHEWCRQLQFTAQCSVGIGDT